MPNNQPIPIFSERRGNNGADIEARLESGERRMDGLDAAIKENTAITEGIKADTAEIVDFFSSMKGAFHVLNWIGALAKPLSYIAMLASAVGGVFVLFKGGSK